jgi:hypothetical protein
MAVPQACPSGWFPHVCDFDILCVSPGVETTSDFSRSKEFKRANCKLDYERKEIAATVIMGEGPAPKGPWAACYSVAFAGIAPMMKVRALKLDSTSIIDGDLDRALVSVGLHAPANWFEQCDKGKYDGNKDLWDYLNKTDQAKKQAIEKEKTKPQ